MSEKTPLHLPGEDAIDRRVVRTRRALYDALVRLILRSDYESISVDDILAEANVGRSTFYSHFVSKDDLLTRSLERLKALLVEARKEQQANTKSGPAAWDFSEALFTHVDEYRDVQRALAGSRGAQIVEGTIEAILAELLRNWLPPERSPGALPRELTIRHTVATFTTVLRWWVERAPKASPAEASVLFLRLVLEGVGGAERQSQ